MDLHDNVDKFNVRAEKCAQQRHMIMELDRFGDVGRTGIDEPFTIRVSKSALDECAEFDPAEKTRQEDEMLEVLSGLVDMEMEYDTHVGRAGVGQFGSDVELGRCNKPTLF